MRIIVLYKTTDDNNRVTIGPTKPDMGTDYVTLSRLVADNGCILTDGHTQCDVVDTYTPDDWAEIDKEDDITAEEALNIITGGAV